MKTGKSTFGKHKLINALFLLVAILVMATPVFANSFNWGFTSNDYGMVIDGKKNGITYAMTAGTMTLSGDIWVDSAPINAGSPSDWKFTIRKVGTLFDTSVCMNWITPSAKNGEYKSFSWGCGSQPAGTYYLYIQRMGTTSDYRIVKGAGILQTQ